MKCKLIGRNKKYSALGIYDGNGITVLKDSVICKEKNLKFRMTKEAEEKRELKEYVDKNGKVIKDIFFKSPSTAAQFITGNSTNGMRQWKNVDTGKSIKESI